jgi:uncharacterized protein (DUF433 family)
MKRRANLDVLSLPNYAPVEAVRYFHVSFSKLEYWVSGNGDALIKLASQKPASLSFKNLVEFYVLEGLREVHQLRMSRIRTAIDYMMEYENTVHPLADYDIRTDGRDVWFYRGSTPVNASKWGKSAFGPMVDPYLKRVLRDPSGVAQGILPFMRKEQLSQPDPPTYVEIDPRRCFGMPVLIGSRITTAFLAGRYRGGEAVPAIAKSYGRPLAEIKEAIQWEIGRKVEAA